MAEVFRIAANIATPMALAGLFAAVFFFVLRQMLALDVFRQLRDRNGETYLLLRQIVQSLFWLSLVAMVLGFLGILWVSGTNRAEPKVVVSPQLAPAPVPETIVEIFIRFRTTGDNREGGTVTVELWGNSGSNPTLLTAYGFPEENWPDNSIREGSQPGLSAPIASGPYFARVRLKDAGEVNIGWNFDVEVVATTSTGKTITFHGNGLRLDTTGRGDNRSAQVDIPQD